MAGCTFIFSSPGKSPGRATCIILPPASALAKCYSFYVKVFYVMGKALSGELSCPCDRSCFSTIFTKRNNIYDFLFASLDDIPLTKGSQLLRKKFAPVLQEQILPFRVEPIKVGNTENVRVVSLCSHFTFDKKIVLT